VGSKKKRERKGKSSSPPVIAEAKGKADVAARKKEKEKKIVFFSFVIGKERAGDGMRKKKRGTACPLIFNTGRTPQGERRETRLGKKRVDLLPGPA